MRMHIPSIVLGYGCYTILFVAQQLYIASGKAFIIVACPEVSMRFSYLVLLAIL